MVCIAHETKVILTVLSERIAQAKTVKEAYNAVRRAASVEGLKLPPLHELLQELEDDEKED